MAMTTAEAPFGGVQGPIYIDINVSEDGEGATISAHTKSPLSVGAGPNPLATFGKAEFKIDLQIDLSGPKPLVTNCQLTQKFGID